MPLFHTLPKEGTRHYISINSAIHQSGGSLATNRSPYRRKNGHILSMGEWPLGAIVSDSLPATGLVNSSVTCELSNQYPVITWTPRVTRI